MPQGRLPGTVLLNDDFGWLPSAQAAGAGTSGDESGWTKPQIWIGGFAMDQKVTTGSHVDVTGGGFRLGATVGNSGPVGALSLGAFFEYGYADYDGEVRGTIRSRAKSDGDVRNIGAGLFGMFTWKNGFYADASFRAGRIRNSFDSDSVTTQFVHYKLSNAYYGAHAGLGYKLCFGNSMLLDFSGRYAWTRQNADTDVILGEKVRFDAVDSHRLRGGVRFYPVYTPRFSPYAGVAFEYEFDGKAKARGGFGDYGSPSTKGGTGIGELGVSHRSSGGKFFVDASVRGYVGKRRGVGANLVAGMNF